ncbi:MAG TPA: hypothetical protein VGK60_07575, partial [Pedococcus sp.]
DSRVSQAHHGQPAGTTSGTSGSLRMAEATERFLAEGAASAAELGTGLARRLLLAGLAVLA